MLISPNSAGVVLGACDYRVALVVERAGEDLVRVALELLQQLARLTVPKSGDLVEPSSQYFGGLRVEHHLCDVFVVA